MREIAFIKQNKEKWLEFELAIFGKAKKNPDELANLYIQMMNDLSYAQTYYPKSKTVVYLNHLASQIYQKIYKTKRAEKNRFTEFFKTEVPLLLYEYRRYLLYSFVLFFVTVAIGVISARYDQNFVRLILGDGYVNMTLENIKKGDPMAVYGTGSNWGSFIGITMNNLYVGARCYIYGIFGGIGTFYIFLQNCIMLGSFQYFFYEQGVFWKSVRGIWIHGSMEIFAIVIETSAGFILGASILFPKTFSRVNSFKIGFKNSFKIFLSTFPFTISAGFLEGFITRYSIDMPNWLSSFIILFTLSIISFYYLVYPYIVHKKTQPLSAKLT
ncbi:MAG: stage II sporulation protein M [Flavobacterium circumlabens]|uniref:Membrane protein SpoIIM required for sporulation n=1 Tax=Flavobacterium circumlabens TaxID=2133765 RepID=A0A4Y7UBJ8_9FLAO|nr:MULTISPECIES: stage II sporulation protein M [Flavobacterium]QSB26193.1 stage II sporulation protein M [Flavobacterium sp. CLA17]TCN57484.1 putative membrane protein SpoIIM required for sporulation [Flavobacterium circumlabens]TEB43796.1 stage II sporulation protein M [Flavobacterium circumlabens]